MIVPNPEFMNNARDNLSLRQPVRADYGPGHSVVVETHDQPSSTLSTPTFVQGSYPCEVDITTANETLVNNGALRQGPIAAPRQYYPALPSPPTDDLLQEYFSQPRSTSVMNPALFDPNYRPLSSFLRPIIPVSEHDRPILNHFVDNVLRLAFPILEVHQQGPERVRAILHSLQTNQPYFHCCLSTAAIHLKTSLNLTGSRIDQDIMRHRYEAVSQLCRTLRDDVDHEQILDATLAMIFFQRAVGSPDDNMPDIPWKKHFQPVTNIVDRLELMATNPYTGPAFNTSLTSWIDIFGATMLGRMPHFANEYRAKHLNGTSSGLKELMGCEDRIMYLVSEIACLDSLKVEGRIEDADLRHHIAALSAQLEHSGPVDQALESPYSPTGFIRPEQLTKNMSALFRTAARIYLNSLTPGFDRNQLNTISLVSAAAEILQFIPTGAYGFDLSLVWPLLITGAFSVQSSSFRGILDKRVKALGELAEFGSFSRMYGLLQEVWKLGDDPTSPRSSDSDSCLPSPGLRREVPFSPCIGAPIRKQQVHWRDVMRRNDWHYLLI